MGCCDLELEKERLRVIARAEVMAKLGARVRRWREAQGISQAAWGARIGLTADQVEDVERGVSFHGFFDYEIGSLSYRS